MNEYDHKHAIKGTRRGKLECPIDALTIIKTWTAIRHKNNIKTLNTKKNNRWGMNWSLLSI